MALDKNNKAKVIKYFAINDQDTGSAQVQVALLTEKIKDVDSTLREKSKRCFFKTWASTSSCQQKELFGLYLKKHNASQYKEIINRLGLRK